MIRAQGKRPKNLKISVRIRSATPSKIRMAEWVKAFFIEKLLESNLSIRNKSFLMIEPALWATSLYTKKDKRRWRLFKNASMRPSNTKVAVNLLVVFSFSFIFGASNDCAHRMNAGSNPATDTKNKCPCGGIGRHARLRS